MSQITDQQIAEAKANIAIYYAYTKLKRSGNWLVGRCPLHDDHDPSFAVRNGYWMCFSGCGHGDTIEFIRKVKRLDFAAAVAELVGNGNWRNNNSGWNNGADRRCNYRQKIADLAGRASEPSPTGGSIIPNLALGNGSEYPASPSIIVNELWSTADHPRLAELYLESRGIRLRPRPLPDALRGHKGVWCTETKTRRPCVLAAIRSGPQGILTGVHGVYVEDKVIYDSGQGPPKGSRATDLKTPKKTWGRMWNGAVRLCEPGETLGLTEGFEDALTVRDEYRIPVWATLGAGRLGSIELPDTVRRVVIFGDNGKNGKSAADRAVSAYRRRGLSSDSVFPENIYVDFNAQYMARLR